MTSKRFQARHGLDNNNQTITRVANPVNATDAANKQYVDAIGTTASNAIPLSQKGAPNGVATLDEAGLIPVSQLPSYVSDVIEYPSLGDFPSPGVSDKIYVAIDTHKVYRWSGSEYIEISPSAGTADAATRLATARTISLSGDVTGSVSFDGTQDVVIVATVGDDSHNHSNATQTTNGFMSSVDKAKLDGVAEGANNYVLPNASESVLGGVKQGANVSITDGVLSVASASTSVAGIVQLSSSTSSTSTSLAATSSAVKTAFDLANAAIPSSEKGAVNGVATLGLDGKVPSAQLPTDVYATISNDASTNATYYPVFATATSGAMTDAKVSSTKLTFNPSTGDLSASNFNSLSDVNYKENVLKLEGSLDKVISMNGYSYDWKDGSGSSYGVIAQELIQIAPNAVSVDSEGKHTVNYAAVVPFLIEAIKEQQKQIEELKSKLG